MLVAGDDELEEELVDLGYKIRLREAELASLRKDLKVIAARLTARLQADAASKSGPASKSVATPAIEARASAQDDFPDADDDWGAAEPADSSYPDLITKFFRQNPTREFTPEEVAKALGKTDNITTVRATLIRLYTKSRILERESRGRYRLRQSQGGTTE